MLPPVTAVSENLTAVSSQAQHQDLLAFSAKGVSFRTRRRGASSHAQRRELLSGSTQTQRPFFRASESVSSRALKRGPKTEARHRASFQTRLRVPPPGFATEGLLPGSAERIYSRARHGGPPLRLGRESLLFDSTQRASSHAHHRGPLLRGSIMRAFSRAQQKGPPLEFGLCRGPLLCLSRGSPEYLRLDGLSALGSEKSQCS